MTWDRSTIFIASVLSIEWSAPNRSQEPAQRQMAAKQQQADEKPNTERFFFHLAQQAQRRAIPLPVRSRHAAKASHRQRSRYRFRSASATVAARGRTARRQPRPARHL